MRGNLTGFPVYCSGPLPALNTKKNLLSILISLKGGDCIRKEEVKIKQCENPLGAVYANRETCQIQSYLSHELIKSKIEYGIDFQFEC